MEANNEIKGFNIAEALKYAPKGLKLYSPLFGEGKFDGIEYGWIRITGESLSECFYEDGRYYDNFPNSECLLFPSVNHRCWNHWQNTLFLESIGSVCVDTITGNKYILGEDGTYFSDNTGSSYHFLIDDEDSGNYLLNSRYASPEETKEFFKELDKNGYYWSNDKQVVQNIIKDVEPKYRVGDVIKHKPTGQINTIKKVCSDYYILDSNNTLYFEAQDIWELVASKVKPTLEEKVNILADEIIALKQRVLALEIQVIRDMSTPPLTIDPYFKSNKITCDVFETPDKAGDNITLEEMKG